MTEKLDFQPSPGDYWYGKCRDQSDGWHTCFLVKGHKGLHRNSFDTITWADGGVVMFSEPGLKKIGNVPRPCLHPEHEPPKHMVYENGVYEYTCPGCGRSTTFTVNGPVW